MIVSRGSPARAARPLSLALLLSLLRGAAGAAVPAGQQDLVAADEDLMRASPLTVAQCRAGCLHKVSRAAFFLFTLLIGYCRTTNGNSRPVSFLGG